MGKRIVRRELEGGWLVEMRWRSRWGGMCGICAVRYGRSGCGVVTHDMTFGMKSNMVVIRCTEGLRS